MSDRRMFPVLLSGRYGEMRPDCPRQVPWGWLAALEGLADYGAHHALMPGHRAATRACLEHMDEALVSDDGLNDRESILAALAVRLH